MWIPTVAALLCAALACAASAVPTRTQTHMQARPLHAVGWRDPADERVTLLEGATGGLQALYVPSPAANQPKVGNLASIMNEIMVKPPGPGSGQTVTVTKSVIGIVPEVGDPESIMLAIAVNPPGGGDKTVTVTQTLTLDASDMSDLGPLLSALSEMMNAQDSSDVLMIRTSKTKSYSDDETGTGDATTETGMTIIGNEPPCGVSYVTLDSTTIRVHNPSGCSSGSTSDTATTTSTTDTGSTDSSTPTPTPTPTPIKALPVMGPMGYGINQPSQSALVCTTRS